MKKALVIFIVVFLVLALATPAFAVKPDKTGHDKAYSNIDDKPGKAADVFRDKGKVTTETWTGTWSISTYEGSDQWGTLSLNQVGDTVTGKYYDASGYEFHHFDGDIYGTVEGSTFSGTLALEFIFQEDLWTMYATGYFDDWVITSDGSSFAGSVDWVGGETENWWGDRVSY